VKQLRNEASVLIGGVVSFLFFLAFLPAFCVIRFADPGGSTRTCSSFVAGLLEEHLEILLPAWLSFIGLGIIVPASGVLTWYLLNRCLPSDHPRIENRNRDRRRS
jgi:hypothetical protein